ncbi:uncharacterized protein LOC143284174 [Babylonia areolata]|uniref:uncharacterized protein LOC143284174 n=1 Tax=Babylonia areolata TaxID=304850 RepID=UPI003FD3B5CE
MSSSILRRLLPMARSARPLWKTPMRTVGELPIRRAGCWPETPCWPYPYMKPWVDFWEAAEQQRLNKLKIKPAKNPCGGPEIKKYSPAGDVIKVTLDKENLLMEMEFNLCNYETEDLCVNLTCDWIIINAQHCLRADKFGYVARQLTRQIHIPEGLDKDSICGNYTDKGNLVLSIKARDEEGFNYVEDLYGSKPPCC